MQPFIRPLQKIHTNNIIAFRCTSRKARLGTPVIEVKGIETLVNLFSHFDYVKIYTLDTPCSQRSHLLQGIGKDKSNPKAMARKSYMPVIFLPIHYRKDL